MSKQHGLGWITEQSEVEHFHVSTTSWVTVDSVLFFVLSHNTKLKVWSPLTKYISYNIYNNKCFHALTKENNLFIQAVFEVSFKVISMSPLYFLWFYALPPWVLFCVRLVQFYSCKVTTVHGAEDSFLTGGSCLWYMFCWSALKQVLMLDLPFLFCRHPT